MLLCNECGSELGDGLVFCTSCGARVGTTPTFPVSKPIFDDETTLIRGRQPPQVTPLPEPPPTIAALPPTIAGPLPPAIAVPPAMQPAAPAKRNALPWLIAICSVALLGVSLAVFVLQKAPAASNTNAGNGGNKSDGNIRMTASASSHAASYRGENTGDYYSYEPSQALDGDLDTAWVEGVKGPGISEYIQCDFGREVTLRKVTITPGYFKSTDIWQRNNRLAQATLSFSNKTSREVGFDDAMEQQSVDTGGVKTRWVRLTINDIYPGNRPEGSDTAISEITFECDECN